MTEKKQFASLRNQRTTTKQPVVSFTEDARLKDQGQNCRQTANRVKSSDGKLSTRSDSMRYSMSPSQTCHKPFPQRQGVVVQWRYGMSYSRPTETGVVGCTLI